MKKVMLSSAILIAAILTASAHLLPATGSASWYGEAHRGRLMANGRKFDPKKLTAASWFYPLGAKVRVTVKEKTSPARTVVVTITDRGPSKELVRRRRLIDLSYGAFKQIADPNLGLVKVWIEPL